MNISLIITTYNRPDALHAVLRGVAAQHMAPSEVLIADDGSGEATRQCVAAWQARLPMPVRHVWHADEGFRAAAIRNRAAALAQGDVLLFLDGDCIPPPDYVARYAALAEQGWFVAGNRILLAAALTERVLAGAEDVLAWTAWRLVKARMCGEVNRLLPLLRLPDGAWRRWLSQDWRGVRTCNLSVWREDFYAVNGFDESFTGWGHEDADLAVRLMRAHVRRKDGRYAAPVLHLWHADNPRGNEALNRARLQETLDGLRPLRAILGVDQYLA